MPYLDAKSGPMQVGWPPPLIRDPHGSGSEPKNGEVRWDGFEILTSHQAQRLGLLQQLMDALLALQRSVQAQDFAKVIYAHHGAT